MIITKAPLRLSMGGGGTDIPAHYKQHGGEWYSLAINKYVYTSISPRLSEKSLIRYSLVEELDKPEKTKNILLSSIFSRYNLPLPIEFTSHACVPSGTGLGSSGSFAVSALATLRHALGFRLDLIALAKEACEIEIDKLNSSSGLQDQYISALGGFRKFKVSKTGVVEFEKVDLPSTINEFFSRHVLLVFTNISRSSEALLSKFSQDLQEGGSNLVNQNEVPKFDSYARALISEDHLALGRNLHQYWSVKRSSKNQMSSADIDSIYDFVQSKGMIGGKLVGAGGGGFILAITADAKRLMSACETAKLATLQVFPEPNGVKIIEDVGSPGRY